MQQRVVSLLCLLVLSQLVLVPLASCRPASDESAEEKLPKKEAKQPQKEEKSAEESEKEAPKQIQKREWKDYAKAGLTGAAVAAGSVGAYKLYQHLKNGQQQPAAGGQQPPSSGSAASDGSSSGSVGSTKPSP